MLTATIATIALMLGMFAGGCAATDATIAPMGDAQRVRVMLDGEMFTDYIYAGLPTPSLYPVIGPHGLPMTRNFPFVEGVKGEATDHPHHRSLWYAHGDVNGVDFWHGGGRVVAQRPPAIHGDTIETANNWVDGDDKLVCTDDRVMRFYAEGDDRFIDFQITIHASRGDVVFGDTKEGTMAIRTHPNLRLENNPGQGVTTANGRAVNSEGVTGKAVWGKRANWVDYWGDIDDHTVGIAIFDHPANPRHPTWWHAREYGLIAANPFGVHDFEKKPAGVGDFTIKAGGSATFRYLFVFHEGDVKQAHIAERYDQWAAK